jgi:tRNA nucleotidyltransferase (CCA-adding enzyme)
MADKHVEAVLKNVIKKIRPSKAEAASMASLVKAALAAASKNRSVRPLICGSVEKGTWLADRRELDMFLLFNPDVSREDLEKKGLESARKVMTALKGKSTIAYAEHPYLKGELKFKGKLYSMDVVPAYDILDPSKIKSAVDRTSHHVKFVKEHLTEGLADEVRLLKAFMKASGCYGADTKSRGFSGYLCELLVIKYGSFLDVLRAAAEAWDASYVIGLNERLDVASTQQRFRAPLIVIDPVDAGRNVAAAVSAETFFRFIQASSHFLRTPSARHFFPAEPKPYSLAEIYSELASRRTRLYLVKFQRPEVVDDILWPQLRRAVQIIGKMLEEGGFRVLRGSEWADERICVLMFELEIWQVPKVVKHIGPSIYSHKQSDAFLDHYSNRRAFVEDDCWIVETERSHTVVLPYLKDIFAQSEKELLARGIPNKLAAAKFDASSGAGAIKAMKALPEGFRIFVREYFEKDLR